MISINTQEDAEPINLVSEALPDASVPPSHGIAAIALSLAVKYADVSTCKDGALYQQYKLEGRNITMLHLDHIFETAAAMEKWLLGASERITNIVADVIVDDTENISGQRSE